MSLRSLTSLKTFNYICIFVACNEIVCKRLWLVISHKGTSAYVATLFGKIFAENAFIF